MPAKTEILKGLSGPQEKWLITGVSATRRLQTRVLAASEALCSRHRSGQGRQTALQLDGSAIGCSQKPPRASLSLSLRYSSFRQWSTVLSCWWKDVGEGRRALGLCCRHPVLLAWDAFPGAHLGGDILSRDFNIHHHFSLLADSPKITACQ